MKSYTDTGPWLAVQQAAVTALDNTERLVVPIRDELQRRRDAAVLALRDAGFAVDVPSAAMYLWVALPDGVPSATFARRAAGGAGRGGAAGQRLRPGGRGILPDCAGDAVGLASRRRSAGWASSWYRPVARSRPPLRLEPPRRARWPWTAIAASIAVHSLLLFGYVSGRLPVFPPRPPQIVVLTPPPEGPRAVELPFREAPPEVGNPTPPVRRPRRFPSGRPCRRSPFRSSSCPRADTGLVRAPTPAARGPIARIGPGLGEGVLWVRPLPLPPRELAQRLRKSHTELVDSAVTATIQAFLDSVAREPQDPNAEWSTEVAGKKFGLSGKYLTIAGLRIPAAVLALLPIGGGSNQQKAFDRTDDLLADLRQAALRAETTDQFKEAIRDLRRRKDEQREFERNQRTPPPAELRGAPPAADSAQMVSSKP